MKTVGIYMPHLARGSHTFIKRQVDSMVTVNPVFLGGINHQNLDFSNHPIYLNSHSGPTGKVKEIALWQYGISKVFDDAIQRENIEAIHAHFGFSAAMILPFCQKRNIPLLVTFHGLDAATWGRGIPPKKVIDRIAWNRMVNLFEYASKIVAVSSHVRNQLLEGGVADRRVEVLHIGTNIPKEIPLGNKRSGILFVGRLVEKKGIFDLLEALSLIPGSIAPVLTIIGEGPEKSRLVDFAREKGLQVNWLGFLPSERVKEEMRRSQVLVVPSKTAANGDQEGLPTVIPEAFSNGLPVIGTRHAGIPEAILDDESGLLVDEGDCASLAKAILRISGDREYANSLAGTAVERLRSMFDVNSQTRKLERLYHEVVD